MAKRKLARIEYGAGWRLFLPKENNAPMLFLEWLSLFPAGETPVHSIEDDKELNGFHVMLSASNDIIHQAKQYINSNL